jgi:hypothetical protein
VTHNTTQAAPGEKNQPTKHNAEIAFPLDPSPASYSPAPITSFFTAKVEEKEGGKGRSNKTKETVVAALWSGSGGPGLCFCGTSL